MFIHNHGSPSSRLWIIAPEPLSSDSQKGYLFSGGAGYVFLNMLKDAGIDDYFITCRCPEPDISPKPYRVVENDINHYKPPFIVALDNVGMFLGVKELQVNTKKEQTYQGQLGKYVGSLLTAPFPHSHYVMPMYGVNKFLGDWTERNITTYFDFQKLREEINFWKKHGVVQPLPYRQLIYKDLDLDELLGYLKRFGNAPVVSVDIETCYPKGDSIFKPHPGYPVTVGLADSASFGISFNLFRNSIKETIVLWRALDEVFRKVTILGQNFFNFDAYFLSMLGFDIDRKKIIDTLIRHHILWPELPHKLQFLTRQYTREPYYKDEGKQWNLKDMNSLRRYNCLDVCVTYEVYMQQEEEFGERRLIA